MQRKRRKRELVLNQFESFFAQNDSKIIKIEKNTHTYFDEMRTRFLLILLGKYSLRSHQKPAKSLDGIGNFRFARL